MEIAERRFDDEQTIGSQCMRGGLSEGMGWQVPGSGCVAPCLAQPLRQGAHGRRVLVQCFGGAL